MPVVGEIKKGYEIGYTQHGRVNVSRYIWHACSDCGKERWVIFKKGMPEYDLCASCAGKRTMKNLKREKSPGWKGGRRITNRGYIEIKLYPDDFFYSMAGKRGYVCEHRLVVAKALGRNLHSWEIVHHRGVKYPKGSTENKQDNRYPENLQLVTGDRHNQITILEDQISRLEKRVTLLEAENTLLRVGSGK